MNLGHALKVACTAKKLSLKELGTRSDLSQSYLSMLESGKRDATLPTIEKIASALEIPTPILLFLAAETGELKGIDEDTKKRLSAAVMNVMRA